MDWPGLLIKHSGIKHILYIWPCFSKMFIVESITDGPCHLFTPIAPTPPQALDTSQLIKQGENNS